MALVGEVVARVIGFDPVRERCAKRDGIFSFREELSDVFVELFLAQKDIIACVYRSRDRIRIYAEVGFLYGS